MPLFFNEGVEINQKWVLLWFLQFRKAQKLNQNVSAERGISAERLPQLISMKAR